MEAGSFNDTDGANIELKNVLVEDDGQGNQQWSLMVEGEIFGITVVDGEPWAMVGVKADYVADYNLSNPGITKLKKWLKNHGQRRWNKWKTQEVKQKKKMVQYLLDRSSIFSVDWVVFVKQSELIGLQINLEFFLLC